MRIGYVSSKTATKEDFDEVPFTRALLAAGAEVQRAYWDDSSVDWSRFDACIVRATWNYYHAHEAFCDWIDSTSRQTQLFNRGPLMRWNSHKQYLTELARDGLPVVETHVLHRGQKLASLPLQGRCVVKPCVSGGSLKTWVFEAGREREACEALVTLAAERDAMVQPFVDSVQDYGERSLVYIDGKLSHVIRKNPRFEGDPESISGPMEGQPAECELAQRALAYIFDRFGEMPLQARVDMAPDHSGRPVIMELELIEPSLFFAQGGDAAHKLVSALMKGVRGCP